jgi:hypothetical protein
VRLCKTMEVLADLGDTIACTHLSNYSYGDTHHFALRHGTHVRAVHEPIVGSAAVHGAHMADCYAAFVRVQFVRTLPTFGAQVRTC